MRNLDHILTMRNILAICFVAMFSGCHSFFSVNAVVSDAETGIPIEGASATLVLDKGVGENPINLETKEDGKLRMWMNEPPSAWATLTVDKNGYLPWSTQFQGKPRHPIVVKLILDKNEYETQGCRKD